ncbi:Uncharacterized protein DAT39_013355 [Clarias magur]|uniref:Uncharacterized protein n=1 Tax=Clarias magur TaxID=1594786 RepID=A0A8J4TWF4_CLAMG|nr:Uncharacterized protein DAT39_013355 [Clarias magur]
MIFAGMANPANLTKRNSMRVRVVLMYLNRGPDEREAATCGKGCALVVVGKS